GPGGGSGEPVDAREPDNGGVGGEGPGTASAGDGPVDRKRPGDQRPRPSPWLKSEPPRYALASHPPPPDPGQPRPRSQCCRPPPPAGLLLAAGAGRRFGGPKALAELDGRPLVLRALATLTAAGCDPVRVVVGAAADEVSALLPDRAQAVRAEGWETGMGASLK